MSDKQTVKFGDICREVKLTTKDPIADGYERYIGLEHLDSGSLKIKRWGMIAEDNPSFTRVFKKGHILFGKRRPYLKKAAVAEFDGICSGDIIVIEPQENYEHPEFLEVLMQSQGFWDWAIQTSSGSLSPRTKFKSISEFSFELPCKNEITGLIKIKRKLESNAEIKQALMDSFDLLLDLTVNKLFNGLDSKLVPLSKVANIEYGISSSIDKSLNEGVKMITLPCVEARCHLSISDDKIAYVTPSSVKRDDYLKTGDVLFNWRNGSVDHIGKSVLINEDMDYTHVGFLLRIRMHKPDFEYSKFIRFYMYWLKINNYFRGSKGQVNKTFNKGELSKLEVPVLERQKLLGIVESLSNLFAIRDSLEEHSNRIQNIKSSALRF
ncbi:Type I restriction modification DNA specificity domain [Shewanella baltica]|uniref:type I restriction endonuclease subunit S n=1 Tax=Shewanella baltica TaxID=62322 RepID=UPI000F703B4F|nr:type I restriction endonuclease subunit S [Shewanella baltica]VEF28179.1 Type I restriction modification DNA specificity domain [Shewanella baltica]